MATGEDHYLEKRYLDELSLQLRTSWQLYLQFYTVFLTVNVIGLGLTLEHLAPHNRWPMALAFVSQNTISFATAVFMAVYSRKTSSKFQEIAEQLLISRSRPSRPTAFNESPLAGHLGLWGGIGNAVSHLALIVCWIVVGRT